ncbi:glycosyltransferase [Synechococcus sp. RSCCF101]|uniref:glycosyltransferase family 2 protein n=1 Tax=Synechococcus sp. RSCCF101 TaxID=2511069 RepID=UPI001782B9BB|nr:glycosyltransferase [Synechococcus sp. RSCCF101]
MLSVIIATFNPSELILEALASVRDQQHLLSCGSLEIVVVDDGSTDPASLALLDGIAAEGIAVLHQPNRGLSSARNAGIRAARAPILLPLDDDNRLLAPYLRSGVPLLLEHPELAGVYGDRQDFGIDNGVRRIGALTLPELCSMNRIDACALIRREWWERCGGYDESLTALEDWDLWLGILRRGGVLHHLPELCFAYRTRPGSMVRRLYDQPARLAELHRVLSAKHGLQLGVARQEFSASITLPDCRTWLDLSAYGRYGDGAMAQGPTR